MNLIFPNMNVFRGGTVHRETVVIQEGQISDALQNLPASPSIPIFERPNCFLFPGFTDVHVHLREPGFSYKETIRTGTLAAARGGYTAVCSMPNLNPVPDSAEHLKVQTDRIRETAVIRVCPFGALTVGEQGAELSDLTTLAPDVIGFSDDGKGVQSDALMREAMRKAKVLGKIVSANCEDNRYLQGGYLHDGAYARLHGHPGIPSECEWRQVRRDLALAEETGCAYHVCHVSCKESVALIRDAKRRGVDVTCETAPHYLLLDDGMLREEGRFRMNPPIRGKADREALIEGVLDGTIDMIATDHAPHSAEEKSGGLRHSLSGVVGLETAFPVLYTGLVKPGILSLELLLRLLHTNPADRFSIGTPLEPGRPATLTVFDLGEQYVIDPNEFRSKGRSTPFEGMEVCGRCLLTAYEGNLVWQDPSVSEVFA